MRILVVNQYFHPDVASTSQILTELCEDLADHHDVTVVAGRPSYNPAEKRPSRGLVSEDRHSTVKVLRTWSTSFSRTNMAGRLCNYATYLASCLAGALTAVRPDVVLTMTDPPLVAAAATVASRIRSVPFVYVNQDIFPEVAVTLGHLPEGMLAGGLRSLNRRLRRSADRVVAIGRDMQRCLVDQGLPSEKVALIPNWADGSIVKPLSGASTLRHRLGWHDRFVVMHSGNVGLSQSLDTLIEAATHLRGEKEILIAVVGDGAAKAALRRKAQRLRLGNVSFLPYQPKEMLGESLGAADVHLVSLRRGLAGFIVPSKVYGIMAAGKPFIAAVEAHSEPALLASEHACGVQVPPDDAKSLAQTIKQMRTSSLHEMGGRGRQAFEQHYDRPIATLAYRRLLEEVVETRPPKPQLQSRHRE